MATEGTVRRLAAVLSVDVVGYGRLMERDEAGTLARLKAVREAVIDPLLARTRGRVVKLIGDGALYEFASAADALACAVEIQRAMAAREADLPGDERLRLRIGANHGDVIVDGDDIYGDGVNVAARLEALAEPGGICVSGKLREEVRRHADVAFTAMGRRRIKNIAEPVEVWRVAPDGGRDGAPAGTRAGTRGRRIAPPVRWALAAASAALLLGLGALAWRAAPPPPGRGAAGVSVYGESVVLAVPPFETADAALAPLAEGVALEVASALAGTRLITVVDAGAAPDAGGTDALGASFVLEGVLRRAADGVRTTASLIDAGSGAKLWSRSYDRPTGDLDALRADLGDHIAAAAFDEVRDAAREAAARKPEAARRAFELVLLANEHRWRWTPEANAEGIALVRRALELEPRSAIAWTELARLYAQQVWAGFAASEAEAAALWREAAVKAVAIDGNYPFARAAMADLHVYARSWDAALAEIDQALALAPWQPEIMAAAAELVLPYVGQSARAAEMLDRARRLDPVSEMKDAEAATYFFARRFREAAAAIARMGAEPSRGMRLLATLIHAELGDAAAVERWRERFRLSWPDYDFEATEEAYFAPYAEAERALWRESHRKAGLLPCAPAEAEAGSAACGEAGAGP